MQGRRKEEFLAFGEHSICSDGGLLFSDFASMMKGEFWLHLEEVLKCNLIIIGKKNHPNLNLLVHLSKKCYQNFILKVFPSHLLVSRD